MPPRTRSTSASCDCEAGAPASFTAHLTSAPARLSVDAVTFGAGSSLTVLGSTFDAAGATRVDPTVLTARFAPVPESVSAVVDTLAAGSYEATVTTSRQTVMRLGFEQVEGAATTRAATTVTQFPRELQLTFNASEISYTASAPMSRVDLSLETFRPSPGPPAARMSRLDAVLLDVPVSARLERTSPTAIRFTTPDRSDRPQCGSRRSNRRRPSRPSAPGDGQYLVAEVGEQAAVAEVRVLGLSRAEVDAGDPVLVDVDHAAGPFRVAAAVHRVEPATDTPPPSPRRVTYRSTCSTCRRAPR